MKTDKNIDFLNEIIRDSVDVHIEGFSIVDGEDEDMPLVYVNDGFEIITGYSRDEVIGRNCRFLQGEKTDRGTIQMLKEKLDKKEACAMNLLNYRKDGSPFWNRLSVYPVYRNNHLYFVGIQSDVSGLFFDAANLFADKNFIDSERWGNMRNLLRLMQDSLGNVMNNLQYLKMEYENKGNLSDESLSFVDSMIERLAENTLDNKENLISKFEFENKRLKPVPASEQKPPKETVLIVEDNEINSRILAKVVENTGHKVLTAENGQKGCELFHRNSDDIKMILMDIQMPVMNGFEATRKLRSEGVDIPVIAVTAHSLSEDIRLAEEAGMSGYITKPYTPEDIEKVLHSHKASA